MLEIPAYVLQAHLNHYKKMLKYPREQSESDQNRVLNLLCPGRCWRRVGVGYEPPKEREHLVQHPMVLGL
jgi:hypothetical protein